MLKTTYIMFQISPSFSICCTFLLIFSVSVNLPKFLEFQVDCDHDSGDDEDDGQDDDE